MLVGAFILEGCSKDENEQSNSGTGTAQTYSGVIKFNNQSRKNSYLIIYNGAKYGTALLLPGTQKSVEAPIGGYQFSFKQQNGYVSGHQLEYTASGTVSTNSTLNATFPELGTLVIKNLTSDPYSVSINNGLYSFTLEGGYQKTLQGCDIGYYQFYVKQQSGYLFVPTERTLAGTLSANSTLTTTIN